MAATFPISFSGEEGRLLARGYLDVDRAADVSMSTARGGPLMEIDGADFSRSSAHQRKQIALCTTQQLRLTIRYIYLLTNPFL
jgi:hypothetical protein